MNLYALASNWESRRAEKPHRVREGNIYRGAGWAGDRGQRHSHGHCITSTQSRGQHAGLPEMVTTWDEEVPDTWQVLDDHFRNYTLKRTKYDKNHQRAGQRNSNTPLTVLHLPETLSPEALCRSQWSGTRCVLGYCGRVKQSPPCPPGACPQRPALNARARRDCGSQDSSRQGW